MADRKRSQYLEKTFIENEDYINILDSSETPDTANYNKKVKVKNSKLQKITDINGDYTIQSADSFSMLRVNPSIADIAITVNSSSLVEGAEIELINTSSTYNVTFLFDGIIPEFKQIPEIYPKENILIKRNYVSSTFSFIKNQFSLTQENLHITANTEDSGATFTANIFNYFSVDKPRLVAIKFTTDDDFSALSSSSTLNIEGLGALVMKTCEGGDLVAGDINSTSNYICTHDPSGSNYCIGGILRKVSGVYNYQDTATAGTPLSLVASTWKTATNNGLGALTLNFPSEGVDRVWNTATNRFDFTDLNLGSTVIIRYDINVTTTSVNQVVRGRLIVAEGVLNIPVNIFYDQFKSAGTYNITATQFFSVLTSVSRDNPARFEIESDSSGTVVVNGWNCGVHKY